MSARYAVYLAPPPETVLWQFGSAVLGYDAATGAEVHSFVLPGFEPAVWRRLTMRPRLYGFHATLKAPFRLSEGRDEAELIAALDDAAAACDAFDLGPLSVSGLADDRGHGFVAMVQSRPSPELDRLESEIVSGFDHFRAPLTAQEIASRRPEQLTPRQREALHRFGYPFIGPDYRFHMTLSGDMADVQDVADKMADAAAGMIGTSHLVVDALVLFRQPNAGEPFTIIRRSPMCEGPGYSGQRPGAAECALTY
jgi:2'-5' RNA ligase